jgi:hypothetical protein
MPGTVSVFSCSGLAGVGWRGVGMKMKIEEI